MIEVRKVTPEDLPMLKGWADHHGCEFHEPLLSPYGFLAVKDGSPVLAVWGYMILDVPVIQLDNLLAVPRQNIASTREAWQALSAAVIAWIRQLNQDSELNYCLIRSFMRPAAAKEAEQTGWVVHPEPQRCAYHVL